MRDTDADRSPCFAGAEARVADAHKSSHCPTVLQHREKQLHESQL